MTTTLVAWLLAVLAVPALVASAYLALLALLSAELPVPPRPSRQLRFDIVVPAHDEAALIGRCLASLARLDWPAANLRVLVIADNCTDATAALARDAGARVLERHEPGRAGKGYALELGFEFSRESGWADAVVVVDADARVSPNLLEAFAARIEAGAGAVQAHYGVLAPEQSWRTRLLAIAHGAFHGVRSRARERLGVSCGVRGNGWCVTHETLARVPHRTRSLTEDLEYGIELGLAGYRVHYAGEASADAEAASDEVIARGQRRRWEHGRFELMRRYSGALLRGVRQRRSALCLDLAFDLLVPPLSYVVLNVGALLVLAAIAATWQPPLAGWLWAGAVASAGIVVYVLRGWQLSGRGAAGLLDLLAAPAFMGWKLVLLLRRHDHARWAPTRRRDP